MRPVYATRLVVLPGPGQSPLALLRPPLGAIASLDGDRGSDRVPERNRPWAIIIMDAGSDTYRVENRDRTCRAEVGNFASGDERAWRGTFVHPYAARHIRRKDLQRRTEIQLRLAGNETVMTIRRLVGATTDLVEPFSYQAQPPSLVHEIIGECHTILGNCDIRPWEVDIARVRDLAHMLTRHDRQAPILVISQTVDSTPLVEPASVARELAGLAKVVQLATFATASHLEAALGGTFPVGDGGMRLYWPNFSVADHAARHPLHQAEELRAEGSGQALIDALRQRLCEQAVWTYGSDRRVWEIEREDAEAHAAARAAEIDTALRRAEIAVAEADEEASEPHARVLRLLSQIRELRREDQAAVRKERERARTAEDDAQGVLDLTEAAKRDVEQQLTNALQRNAAQKQEAADLRRVVEHLELGLAAADERRADAERASLVQIEAVKNLADVLSIVESTANRGAIVYLPQARESAAKSHFQGNLLEALRTLRRLCKVADLYHRGEMLSFSNAFETEGESDFASRSDEQTLKMHRKDYTRTYDPDDGSGPREILLSPHLSHGTKAGRLFRIYWYVDSRNLRLVVGHVGDHLPVYSQNRQRRRNG